MIKGHKNVILVGIIIIALIIISAILALFSDLGYVESIRIVFGSVYVLFLPGFVISYIFFPRTIKFEGKNAKEQEHNKGSVDLIERIALSFALSIAIVPLAAFYLNLIGIKINLLNSFLTVLGIVVISIGILVHKNKKI